MRHFVHIFMVVLALLAGEWTIAQTPLVYYSFTGNTKDSSPASNHAQPNGVVLTTDRFGVSNSALFFDGKQGSLTARALPSMNTAKLTLSFWINVKELPGQGEVYVLSHGGWQERWKISLPSHGKPVFTTHSGGNCCSDMDSGQPLETGKWTHLTMVHDGAKNIIYVNGVKASEKSVSGDLDPTNYPLGMGFDPIDKNYFFTGSLDEIMLFGEALSADAIAALYASQSTAPAFAEGKVASFDFNGNSTDASAFTNNAVAENAGYGTDRFGYGKSAVICDGSSTQITASGGSQLNSGKATISFWVRPRSFPGSGEVYILSHGGWQERWKISMPSHGKPVFTTHSGGNCCSDMDSGTPLELNKWTHVAMVHDGSKNIIYMNGVSVNQKNVTGDLDPTNYPFGMGWNPIDGGGHFDGALDQVELYNVALGAADIAALYAAQATFGGSNAPEVAVYSLNGNGKDASQFSNDGSLSADAQAVSNRHGWASNALDGAVTADPSPALQSDYTTISFWVKPASFPGSGEVYLLSHGGWQERWKISMPSHGKPVFTTHSNGACCSDMDSGTPLELNKWTHVAMVHDGTKNIIYLNGQKASEKNVTGKLDKTNYPLGLGYDPIDKGSYFDGALDDVIIVNKALSAEEIAALYDLQRATPQIADGLVAYYPFEGNGFDVTQYGNNSTGLRPGKDRFGKSNMAASFNGTSTEVIAANSPQLNSARTTVSFWVNPKSFAGNGETFILSHGGWQERWKISLPSHGKPVWTTNHTNGISDMDSGTPLLLNAWTHVVMVHDGAKDLIYFNGAKVAEKNVAGTLNNTTKNLGFGYNPIDGGNWFDGALDEVQIYNIALTDSEIAALYAEQSAAPGSDDTEAPDAPLNLSADVVFNNVGLTWNPSSDDKGVVAYNVYIDGAWVNTVEQTSAYFPALTPLTDYVFGVSAVDAAGNESQPSTIKVTTGPDESPDTTAPSTPANLKGAPSFSSVLLSWDASTDDRRVEGYYIYVDGDIYETVGASTLSVLVRGLEPSTLYSFEVAAFDLAGNVSPFAELTLETTEPLDTGEPGLVAHYPFENNANDATPYNNHGEIGGNPEFIDASHAHGGRAIKFDGVRDSVLAPNAVQLLSDFASVSFWIRVDGTNLADAEAYVMDFGHWDQRWKISLPQHLKIVWTTNSNNTQFPNFISDMDSGDGNEMVKGFWWYVTMVHDGTDDIIYVNGVETKRKPAPGKLNSTTRPICFGNNPIEGGQYFTGALDNVKIYNRALTAEEAARLFQNGSIVSSVKDVENGTAIEGVFPNPAAQFVTVNHSIRGKSTLVRIFDMQGRQFHQQMLSPDALQTGQISFNIAGYPKGTYHVQFGNGIQNLGTASFVKE
jgi:hypothetical protein